MAKDAGGKSKQIQASKAQAKAAKGGEGGKGGKAKKKKWSKGRVREKLNNAVLFEQAILDKLTNEVPKWKLITPSVVVDRLKVNGSLARQGLDYLEKEGLIKRVAHHNMNRIYTRTTAASKAAADEEEAEAKPKKDAK